MLNLKKVLKISLISISSILLLLIIGIILLLIFFPSELVRKELEKQATSFLKTDVKLEKLRLSILSGIELKGLTVKQFGNQWQTQYILSIDKAYLKYSLLPIIFKKELYVKACVVESGVVNLERNKKGSNWDHFMNIFNKKGDGSNKIKKEQEKKIKLDLKSLPIDIDLNKAGFENLTVNFIDRSFFNIPVKISLNESSVLAKNLRIKNNKPFDLASKITIDINGGEFINLNSFVKTTGKLKIFDETSGSIFLNGPIKINLNKIYFSSKIFKEVVIKYIDNFIESAIGPELNAFLKDPQLITKEADLHFDNILNNSRGTIDKERNKAEKISMKKKDFVDYKTEVMNGFTGQMNAPLSEIDSKIDKIDDTISPIIEAASSIPLVSQFVDLEKYENKIKALQKDSKARRDNLKGKYQGNLEKELMDKINSIIPAAIPSYGEYEKEFLNRVNFFKTDLAKNLNKFSISSLINTYMPDLSFMDKGIDLSSISATYYLNKQESSSKDFKVRSKYLNIDGDFKNKKSDLDFIGNININNDFLKIGFLPVSDIKAKVQVFGEIKNLRVKLLELPELKIDESKIKDAATSIINNFLNKNYGESNIISDVLKKFKIADINEKDLKKSLLEIKDLNFEKMLTEKDSLLNFIDKDTSKIIDELKGRIPGL